MLECKICRRKLNTPKELEIHKKYFHRIVHNGQAYFWTKEWQEAEAEADDDIRNGRVTRFSNAKAAIKYLHQQGQTQKVASGACPDCGSTLFYQEGCVNCQSCGYSKCG